MTAQGWPYPRGSLVYFDSDLCKVGTVKPHKRGTHVELVREADHRMYDLLTAEEWLHRIRSA